MKITDDRKTTPFSSLVTQIAGELQHWRRHEAECGRLPGGGLDEVWPQCVAIYGIPLRSPGIDEARAWAVAVGSERAAQLSEDEHRQIFQLVWQRSRQLHEAAAAVHPRV